MKSYNPGNFKRQCFNSVQTVFKLLPESDPRPYISITCDAKGNPSPQNTSWPPKTQEKKFSKHVHPSGSFEPLRAVEDCTKRGTTGRIYCTRAGPPGAPPPDDAVRKISRPTAAGRAGIWPANPMAAMTIFHLSFVISGHFPATSGHPMPLSTIFEPSELIYVVPFCRFRTVWKLH